MKNKNKIFVVIALCVMCLAAVLLTGCGGGKSGSSGSGSAPQISGLTYSSTMKLDYAKCFDVYYYKGGYALIDVYDDTRYLVVPQGKKIPSGLSKKIVVIRKPVDHIYLAATSSMALFSSMDAVDHIKMTELKASGWSVKAARNALEQGKMVYAGKYSQPDYELLLNKKCDLAIESTMIYHTPEVKDMIEDLKIPVLVDRSSYESDPLGRTEWIKLYSVLVDKEKTADKFFDRQAAIIEKLKGYKNTEKTVAFFYVSSDGKVVVRSSSDYVPTMIETAGARYIFKDLKDKDSKSSIPMTMEKFYDQAADADYIIYNGSIDSSVRSVKDLEAKDAIFKKFKAVKNDNCWITGSSLYQRTDIVGEMVTDLHKVFTEKDPQNLKFIKKME
jgi:iron complex transport system substrate-binding protein